VVPDPLPFTWSNSPAVIRFRRSGGNFPQGINPASDPDQHLDLANDSRTA